MLKDALLSYLLRQTQLANYQQLDAVVQEFGLTPSQYMVLGIVKEHREGVSSSALARRLGVAPQSSHEIVAGLERRGLVRRMEDLDGSRRVLRVYLAPKGAALLTKCDKQVARFEQSFFGDFSPQELTTFRTLLMRLIRDSREKAATDALAAFGTR